MVRSIWCWIWWGRGGKAALACVKPGGRLVTVPTITAQQIRMRGRLGVEVVGMLVHPDRTQLTQMLTLLRRRGGEDHPPGEFTLAEGRWPIRPSSRAMCAASCCCACPPADGQPG